ARERTGGEAGVASSRSSASAIRAPYPSRTSARGARLATAADGGRAHGGARCWTCSHDLLIAIVRGEKRLVNVASSIRRWKDPQSSTAFADPRYPGLTKDSTLRVWDGARRAAILQLGPRSEMGHYRLSEPLKTLVPFALECVAKLFRASGRAILIQE